MADEVLPPQLQAESHEALTEAQRALRAQLLATEHWSLLASRSTTQSEVLVRIALYLTLVSAGLVTVGVIGQATGFRGWFGAAAIAVLWMLAVLGFLTQLRVFNAGMDDLVFVIGMNRLRAAYLDLDPGLDRYLVTGTTDDERGVSRTYYPYSDRPTQVPASTMMIITLVCAVVFGLAVASIIVSIDAPAWVCVLVGAVVGVAYLVVSFMLGNRGYRAAFATHRALRTTDPRA